MVHSVAILPICHRRPSESASAETFDPKHWRVRPWRHVFDHNTFMVLLPLRHILDSLNTPELMQMHKRMLTNRLKTFARAKSKHRPELCLEEGG